MDTLAARGRSRGSTQHCCWDKHFGPSREEAGRRHIQLSKEDLGLLDKGIIEQEINYAVEDETPKKDIMHQVKDDLHR